MAGYYDLIGIYKEAQDLQQEFDSQPPLCCPNDAQPLDKGPNGILFCKWDGWVYEGGRNDYEL